MISTNELSPQFGKDLTFVWPINNDLTNQVIPKMKTHHDLRRLRLFLKLLVPAIALTSQINNASAQPVVFNVQAAQRTGTALVDIYYSVSSPSNSLSVAVSNSINGGVTFNSHAASLSGDIGSGIEPGTGKHVVWNAGADLTPANFTEVVVLVAANDGALVPAPEPSTIFAGVLMLVPLGFSIIRILKKFIVQSPSLNSKALFNQ